MTRRASITARSVLIFTFATVALAALAGVAGGRDSSSTWQEQDSGVVQDLTDVDLADPMNGWAVGGGGTIVATSDGGATWTTQRSGTTADLLAVAFVDSRTGWAAGVGGVVLETTDGGDSWTVVRGGDGGDSLAGIGFASPSQGWAVGGDSILVTTDGGATWTPQETPGDGGFDLSAVAVVDATRGYAAGTAGGGGGVVLETTDGGATWIEAATTGRDLHEVAAAGPTAVWAAGDDGSVLVFDGESWTPADASRSPSIDGLAPRNSAQATAVGARNGRGVVLSSADGGATWIEETVADADLAAVDFSGMRGCAVGGGGTILRYDPSATPTAAGTAAPPAPPAVSVEPSPPPSPAPAADDRQATDWATVAAVTLLTMVAVGLVAFFVTGRRG